VGQRTPFLDTAAAADGLAGKIHRAGPNFGPALRPCSGFSVKTLGQLENSEPTLWISGPALTPTEEDEDDIVE
jgi:hypothetical protein